MEQLVHWNLGPRGEWPQLAQTSYQEPVQGFQMYQKQKWTTSGQIWTDDKSPNPKVGVKDVAFFRLSYSSGSGGIAQLAQTSYQEPVQGFLMYQ